MEIIDRRTIMVGVAAAAAALAGNSQEVSAQGPATQGTRPPDQEGVTRAELNQGPSMIPGYKQVMLVDVTVQPGKKFGPNKMQNAMVCHVLEGELEVTQEPGTTFTAKKNHVWTCNTSMSEGGINKGTTPAIMRIAQLIP